MSTPHPTALVDRKLLTFTVSVLLFGLTLLIYTRVLEYGFTNYDDPRYVTANPNVQQGFSWAAVQWALVHNADYWHPLTWLSHLADWAWYGDAAAGHHLTSVLWHAANAVLVFFLLARLGGAFWTAALAAAVFAWHPLRVESVAWVTERKDVMSGFFLLAMLGAYVRYAAHAEAPAPARRPVRWYVLTLALFAAGLMSKPSLVTAPLLLLALDAWPLRRHRSAGMLAARWRTLVLEKVPFFVLSVLTAVITVMMQAEVGAFTLRLPLLARLANVPVAIARYLGKTAWPADLAVCYRHPGWWSGLVVVGAMLLVGLITGLAWRWRTRRPWFGFGWCWFLILLLPMSGVVQVGFQSMADRYTYAPMIGVVFAACLLAGEGARRFPRGCAVAALVLLAALLARTWQQQGVWRDSETLFRHAARVTEKNDMAEAFLAYTLAESGRYDEAETHATRAVGWNPKNAMALVTLAQVRIAQQRLEEGAAVYREVLAINPRDASSRFALGILRWHLGDRDEAAALLRRAVAESPALLAENRQLTFESLAGGRLAMAAVRWQAAALLEPDEGGAHFASGRTLARLGRDAEAAAYLERAVALRPEEPEGHVELGLVLLRRGQPAAAVRSLEQGLAHETTRAVASVGLGRAHEQLGQRSEADAAFAVAMAAAPNDADVCRAWAEILARRGRFGDAAEAYLKAVALRPGDATSHAGLGFVLLLSGRRTEAAAAWREALRLNPEFPGLRQRLEQLGR